MVLNKCSVANKEFWLGKSYNLPQFDVAAVAEKTRQTPVWLHFGAGNIFRCFPALAHQKLLNAGLADTGIVVCEMFDEEIIDKAFVPHNNLNITVTAKADGSVEKTVAASIVHAIKGSDTAELERVFTSPSLQMISYTITEKGYQPTEKIIIATTNLLHKRWQAGAPPIALVSMDNCSHNGEKLKAAVVECAKQQGLAAVDFLAYLEKSAFPLSMIDKITPRPTESVQKLLSADGVETEIFCTAKNTYVSAFVNAEATEYLVIEDKFPNGRPPLEKAGVIFTDANTVDMVEKMKVCTCLNPLHTVLAVFGCLLGYETVWEAMKNNGLRRLVEKIGYDEGLPVVVDPGIINPKQFIDTVLNERFPNSFIPDTPQRIACDTSQKIPVRFGETLKIYAERGVVNELEYIPLFIAGWLRYLMAVDDKGNPFTPSPDPRLDELMQKLSGIKLGDAGGFSERIKAILADKTLFGINLNACGLGNKVEAYFNKMVSRVGAVQEVLEQVLRGE